MMNGFLTVMVIFWGEYYPSNLTITLNPRRM
jgi:hypothetical protein